MSGIGYFRCGHCMKKGVIFTDLAELNAGYSLSVKWLGYCKYCKRQKMFKRIITFGDAARQLGEAQQ